MGIRCKGAFTVLRIIDSLIQILKRTHSFYLLTRRTIKWSKEAHIYKMGQKKNRVPDNYLDEMKEQKIMILIPHSDDEWVGCSRIIKSGKQVTLINMDMKGGDSEKIHLIRESEMQKNADNYNRRLIKISSLDKTKSLCEIINEINPDLIFLPYFLDWHIEHLEVMEILDKALQNCANKEMKIGMYQVSVPIDILDITVCKAMTRHEWKQKWGYFYKTYVTQRQLSYRRFAFQEYINGYYGNSYASEVYSINTILEWRKKLAYRLTQEDRDLVMNSLSELGKIRGIINSIRSRCDV